jgi:hypothetical protein
MAEGADTRCPSCGGETPRGSYCVDCGALLHPVAGERGRHFAAAPNQHLLTPGIVSTLFPHLPLRGHNTFRALLWIGILLVGSLSLAGLFPVALIAAAVLVPLLVLLYLREVNLYEQEPLRVLALTVVWGAAAGVALGLLRDRVESPGSVLASQTTTHAVIWNGVALPLIGLVVVLGGPLVLLARGRFDDVLDGVTFGGAAAVSFAGAELLTHSSVFLAGGLAPAGLVAPWTLRVLTLGVAVPVLAAAMIGAASGALWLHYRAPAGDGFHLRMLGQPVLAVALAALALVGSALIQLYLNRWTALAALVVLDIGALIWLRLLIHVGLVEVRMEAGASSAGACVNCGRAMPRAAFCSYCGVATRALPKSGRGHSRRDRGAAGARFGVGLAVLVGAAVAVMAAVEPGAYAPPCKPGQGCADPPRGSGSLNPALRLRQDNRVWVSSLGVRVSYDASRWQVLASSGSELDLTFANELELTVQTRNAGGVSEQQTLEDQVDFLRGRYPDLELDAGHPVVSAQLGAVAAVGGLYAGHDAVYGRPVEALIEAATQANVTALVSAWTSEQAQSSTDGSATAFGVFVNADAVLEGFQWPSAASGR